MLSCWVELIWFDLECGQTQQMLNADWKSFSVEIMHLKKWPIATIATTQWASQFITLDTVNICRHDPKSDGLNQQIILFADRAPNGLDCGFLDIIIMWQAASLLLDIRKTVVLLCSLIMSHCECKCKTFLLDAVLPIMSWKRFTHSRLGNKSVFVWWVLIGLGICVCCMKTIIRCHPSPKTNNHKDTNRHTAVVRGVVFSCVSVCTGWGSSWCCCRDSVSMSFILALPLEATPPTLLYPFWCPLNASLTHIYFLSSSQIGSSDQYLFEWVAAFLCAFMAVSTVCVLYPGAVECVLSKRVAEYVVIITTSLWISVFTLTLLIALAPLLQFVTAFGFDFAILANNECLRAVLFSIFTTSCTTKMYQWKKVTTWQITIKLNQTWDK